MLRYDFNGDHLVVGGRPVAFRAARDVGGRITPRLIVLHDTAGGLDASGSINWLAGNPNKTSAHFVVARDGTITQLAAPDRKCNHAGQSSWRGREFCNGFAVGIEIVNPGKLLPRGAGAVASFGKVFDRVSYDLQHAATDAHGDGMWMPYTEEQLAAVEALVAALGRSYPTIKEVVGHHDVSPGRKVDPTPLMEWGRMREALLKGSARQASLASAPPLQVDVPALQARLKALGYYTGIVDGVLGARTIGAVTAMQVENGLPTTGQLDAATIRLLESGEAKAMPTGHREEATEQTLIAQGSQTTIAAKADRTEGAWQAILAATTAALVAVRDFVATAGVEIAILGLLAVGAYFGLRQLQRGGFLRDHRLAEHKAGVK